MRTDELASKAEIERDEKFRGNIKKGVTAAVGIGTSLAGAGLTARMIPFFSDFISSDMAVKGLSKIDPRLGQYFKKGRDMGLDVEEGLNFLKSKFQPAKEVKDEEKKSTPDNPIEKENPNLHNFILGQIQKGENAQQALSTAAISGFDPAIQAIAKKFKINLSQIVDSLYPSANVQQPQSNPQQSLQSGQGQQALMAILQKIQQARGG